MQIWRHIWPARHWSELGTFSVIINVHKWRKHKWPLPPFGLKGYISTCSCHLRCAPPCGCSQVRTRIPLSTKIPAGVKKLNLVERFKLQQEAIVHGRQDCERGFCLPACHLRCMSLQSQPALVLSSCWTSAPPCWSCCSTCSALTQMMRETVAISWTASGGSRPSYGDCVEAG